MQQQLQIRRTSFWETISWRYGRPPAPKRYQVLGQRPPHQHLPRDQRWSPALDWRGRTPPRMAIVREATTGHPPNEVYLWWGEGSCRPVKAISELVVGQKTLEENLQKQQKILASSQIQWQRAALEKQQQALSQLSMGSQKWWQPGCFGRGSQTHICRDCTMLSRRFSAYSAVESKACSWRFWSYQSDPARYTLLGR